MVGPLENIRVVEISHMIMGPTCGLYLAQLGAEVIKVEPPQGDKTRALGGMGASFFPTFNRGKKSVAIDTAAPAGWSVARLQETGRCFRREFPRRGRWRAWIDTRSAEIPALLTRVGTRFPRDPHAITRR